MDEIYSVIEKLYRNNGSRLCQMCHKEMVRFGGIPQKDYDDFYSRAGYDIALAIDGYDPSKGKAFIDYISGVIRLSVRKEMTCRNRNKRQNIIRTKIEDCNGGVTTKTEYVPDVSLDVPVDGDDDLTVGDTLQSDFDIEQALIEKNGEAYSETVEHFLAGLSDMQQKIVRLIMDGYSSDEIKDALGLSVRQYKCSLNEIKSYDKKRIFYKYGNDVEGEDMDTTVLTEDVTESYKNTSYSIESISKQLHKRRIRDDHILQRHSGQWKSYAKSELISDILRGKSLTQIIISEEIKNGIKMQWLIDGKQRCTTLDDFFHEGFAISKNVKNYSVRYQANRVDECGNEVLNEEGFTEVEFKEFDIRGKKFSQLPEELQDIFKDRQIPVLYNMNCTKKDIADDIARFNRSRPMNKSQNGWLGLDERFAEFVENMAKMQFFQTDFAGSSYTKNNITSGAVRRIIVESIMVSDFIEEFCDFDRMCKFLSEEASDSNFTGFYSLIERLTSVACKEISVLFNAKDSFLWFGLFSGFVKFESDDKRFVRFLKEFIKTLHSKKVNGKSFDEILEQTKATKDRNVVIRKLWHLEKLMKDYLSVNVTE